MLMCFPLFEEQRKKANIQIQLMHAIGVHSPNTSSSSQQNIFAYRNTIKPAKGHNFIELKSWIRRERSARSVTGTRGKLLKHRVGKAVSRDLNEVNYIRSRVYRFKKIRCHCYIILIYSIRTLWHMVALNYLCLIS